MPGIFKSWFLILNFQEGVLRYDNVESKIVPVRTMKTYRRIKI